MDFDVEGVAEMVDGPGVVFAGVVAGEVVRGDIGYVFEIDADYLERMLDGKLKEKGVHLPSDAPARLVRVMFLVLRAPFGIFC